MSSKFQILSVFVVVFCLSVAGGVKAQDQSPQGDRNLLRFGIMALAPYGFQDNNGNWVGNLYEIADAIIAEGGFEGYSQVVPLKRLFQKDRLDCSIAGAVPFMEKNYARVASLGQELVFGIMPLKQVTLNAYEDLKELVIAVPLGVNVGLPFDEDERLKKIEVRDYSASMRMLERERVDAAAGVINSLLFSARIYDVDEDKFGEPLVFSSLPLNVYCERESITRGYWDQIDAAVEALKSKGEIDRIMKKYQ
ncbi:MAG: transporter substrate-binding domain-containing protein [Magnetovibrio sp.]|nr:transporter substrate-binding domain-containing protein [Magnetovibrio sp.]